MALVRVGRIEDFESADRVVGEIDGREIVVFRLGEQFVAFENRCPHLGGPVGEGKVAAKVEVEETDFGMTETFSKSTFHLVCPWHGYEFSLESGKCWGDARMSLRRYDVVIETGTVCLETSPARDSELLGRGINRPE